MNYTEYPNNSLAAKQETKVEPVKKLAPVAKAKKVPKSFWRKTADEFFGNNPEDGKTIGEHVWFDGVIPFVKNGIVDIVARVLLGDSYTPRGIIGQSMARVGASKIGYSSISTAKASGQLPKAPEQRLPFDYDELIFATRGEAESVLERMFELIDSPYQRVTVGDLYDLSQVSPGPYTNCNYGWYDLTGARVRRNYDNSFSLDLPKPRPLK